MFNNTKNKIDMLSQAQVETDRRVAKLMYQMTDLIKKMDEFTTAQAPVALHRNYYENRMPDLTPHTMLVYASITPRSRHFRIYLAHEEAKYVRRFDFMRFDFENRLLIFTNNKVHGTATVQVAGDMVCINSRKIVEQIFGVKGVEIAEMGRTSRLYNLAWSSSDPGEADWSLRIV